jgi:hypothetical protein
MQRADIQLRRQLNHEEGDADGEEGGGDGDAAGQDAQEHLPVVDVVPMMPLHLLHLQTVPRLMHATVPILFVSRGLVSSYAPAAPSAAAAAPSIAFKLCNTQPLQLKLDEIQAIFRTPNWWPMPYDDGQSFILANI